VLLPQAKAAKAVARAAKVYRGAIEVVIGWRQVGLLGGDNGEHVYGFCGGKGRESCFEKGL